MYSGKFPIEKVTKDKEAKFEERWKIQNCRKLYIKR